MLKDAFPSPSEKEASSFEMVFCWVLLFCWHMAVVYLGIENSYVFYLPLKTT